jgi:hypothetical protein
MRYSTIMTDTFTPACRCPYCETKINGQMSTFEDARPAPGDFTLCIICGKVLAFRDDLTVRRLTPAEELDAARHPQIVLAVWQWHQLKDRTPDWPKPRV